MLDFKEYFILGDILFLNELSVNPNYRTKAGFFPYYIMKPDVEKEIKSELKNPKDIKFRCVATKSKEKREFDNILKKSAEKEEKKKGGGNVIVVGNGGFIFHVHTLKNKPFKYKGKEWYVQTTKAQVKAHDGVATRKDATAAANINEYCSMYFLKNSRIKKDGLEKWMNDVIGGKRGGTGVRAGAGNGTEISYEALAILLNNNGGMASYKDVLIGWNNAKEVARDLKDVENEIIKYWWTPAKKPGRVNQKNPSDVMVELTYKGIIPGGRSFRGYSNKATSGKDKTPKFNTNVDAFYEQFGDPDQVTAVEDFMDEAITYVTDTLWTDQRKKDHPKSWEMIKATAKSIMNDEYSESGSKATFQKLGTVFDDEELDFYGKDFYHPYRNWFIGKFAKHLEDAENLAYFLRTISLYTWGVESDTDDDCPYKLLVGTEKSSTITEVSSDENKKSALSGNDKSKYTKINTTYDHKSQSFKLDFDVEDKKVNIPITARTRAEGGFSGKSLFITTSGVKVT